MTLTVRILRIQIDEGEEHMLWKIDVGGILRGLLGETETRHFASVRRGQGWNSLSPMQRHERVKPQVGVGEGLLPILAVERNIPMRPAWFNYVSQAQEGKGLGPINAITYRANGRSETKRHLD